MSLLTLFAAPPPLTQGVVFHDGFNSSANYNGVYGTATVGGNAGMFGKLGASGSLHMTLPATAYSQQGLWKQLSGAATIFNFYVRPASTFTLGANGVTLFTVYTDSTLTNSSSPARVDLIPNGSGYNLAIVDSSNTYATTTGTTLLTLGTVYRINLSQTSAGWKLYINNNTAAEVTYAHTQTVIGYSNIFIGTNSENGPTPASGVIDYDELWCGNLYKAPSTTAAKITDAYQGYLMNHLSADGQPYRGPTDGVNLSSAASIDTVSEGAAYLVKLAVQQNDQASFILCDNWIIQNLIRSVSTTGNTQNNAAPTTALNLMSFHYNSANTDGKGVGTIYDANFATDADCDRLEALFWAHGRWGSSAYTVGSTNELATPNYLQRALNVAGDIRNYAMGNSTLTGYNYLLNDSFQTGNNVVQLAPDYNNPVAFKLAQQYDTANASFWNNAVLGTYDVIEKSATTIFTGAPDSQSTTSNLPPDWVAFTLSTATVSSTRSTYGDPNYGYNAFRTSSRLYDAYLFYGDSGALTALQEPKSFFTSQWGSLSKIYATYNHDGTNPSAYESNMFYFADYWALYANDNTNTTASAINTNKIAITNTYNQAPFGSYFNTAPGTLQYGYFDQSWLIYNYMQQSGTLMNYGTSTTHSYFQSFTGGLSFVGAYSKRLSRNQSGVLSYSGAYSKLLGKKQTAVLSYTGAQSKAVNKTVTAGLNYTAATILPTSVPNLTTWLKADSLALSDGNSVATWTDSSGNSNNATASGAAQPVYKTNIFNGLPVVRFNGTSTVLALPNTETDQTTVFIAYTNASGTGSLISELNASGAWLQRNVTIWVNANQASVSLNNGINTFNLYTQQFDYTNNVYNVYGNGTLNGSSTSSYASITGGTVTYEIGARGGNSEYFTGDIAEVIIYNRILTPLERSKIDTYLGKKYAVANTDVVLGGLTKSLARSINAGLSFIGSLPKAITKGLVAATLGLTGSTKRGFFKAFSGIGSFVGAIGTTYIPAGTLHLVTLTAAAVGFVGSFGKLGNKLFTASTVLSGSMTRIDNKKLTAGLGLSGLFVKNIRRAFTGVLSYSGSFSKRLQKSLSGALAYTGGVAKRIQKAVSGGLSLSGNIITSHVTGVILTAASLGFSGSVSTLAILKPFFKAIKLILSLPSIINLKQTVPPPIAITLSIPPPISVTLQKQPPITLSFKADSS